MCQTQRHPPGSRTRSPPSSTIEQEPEHAAVGRHAGDTFDFEVPPNMLREVSFIYEKIWQHGFLRIEEDGNIREAPFRVALRLEVDLAQNDKTD